MSVLWNVYISNVTLKTYLPLCL
ncbi:hypothetical protein CGRA01v4_08690 [Colletotrichum graminicola]|nr:hypothetical protein CGRA01v4_08690 [Colletotrichum graminicola]